MGTIEHLLNYANYPDMLLGNLGSCHRNIALHDTSLESLGHAFYGDIMVARETMVVKDKFKKSICYLISDKLFRGLR